MILLVLYGTLFNYIPIYFRDNDFLPKRKSISIFPVKGASFQINNQTRFIQGRWNKYFVFKEIK